MEKIIQVAPSLLAANFENLHNELKQIEDVADLLHFDVMDGHFVDNLSFGVGIAQNISRFCTLPQDVHLMVEHPLKFIPSFAKNGAEYISFHIECDDNIEECIDLIHSFGVKAAVALNPDTDPSKLFYLKGKIDMILQMTVFPGFGGQALVREAIANVKVLREYFGDDFNIEVDGGIKLDNVKELIDAGANVIVAGTTVFKSENPAQTCKKLKEV